MNRSAKLLSSIAVLLAVATGCSADDQAPAEVTSEASSAATVDAAAQASGVPRGVLVNYRFWSVSGPNIPAEPPAASKCDSPLNAVGYAPLGCLDAKGNDASAPAAGIYCSANDGAGVTEVQSRCLGGWLMAIPTINGKRIPSNVVLTGANKVAAGVTRVVLLECPSPPAGLETHNVLYKAVYNNGIFASSVPRGCTAYELAAR